MAPHADGQILVVKPGRKEAMRELLLAKALSLDTGSLSLGQTSADVTWVGGGKINSILCIFLSEERLQRPQSKARQRSLTSWSTVCLSLSCEVPNGD